MIRLTHWADAQDSCYVNPDGIAYVYAADNPKDGSVVVTINDKDIKVAEDPHKIAELVFQWERLKRGI